MNARIIVHHVDELPGGLPALWTDDPTPNGSRHIQLYLRGDLPQPMADHFRAMAIRDCVPDAQWDDFTVEDGSQPQLHSLTA